MTELELTQRAKMYIDKMANGINPITGNEVAEEDCVNNVRVSRCLFFVSDLLRQILENGGVGEKKKIPFRITDEQLRRYDLSETPITLSEIVKRINALVESSNMKKLTYTDVASFLVYSEYLESITTEEGKTTKQPSAKGTALGIVLEQRAGKNGTYYVSGYNVNAQRFIVENMQAILEFKRNAQESEDS